jgi:hypothetical protein
VLKQSRENRTVACLTCWKCHGRAGPNHYTLRDGGAVRGLCGDRNPLGNLRQVPLGVVKAEHEIIVCYVPRDGYNVHGLHLDCRTVLGPWVHVASADTLTRLLRYMGATDEQVAKHEQDRRSWARARATFGCFRTNVIFSGSITVCSEVVTV